MPPSPISTGLTCRKKKKKMMMKKKKKKKVQSLTYRKKKKKKNGLCIVEEEEEEGSKSHLQEEAEDCEVDAEDLNGQRKKESKFSKCYKGEPEPLSAISLHALGFSAVHILHTHVQVLKSKSIISSNVFQVVSKTWCCEKLLVVCG
ncbi:hypothetical protein LWI29_010467 [Acer saccharum]|uniref:Uncharacterized protein n=1 Tax=Acer saccharum TaxID=4024 RepID=A0AA39TEB3_ACESA|nr:hypothetical protein LWI29_010467 [Acer saccharum]